MLVREEGHTMPLNVESLPGAQRRHAIIVSCLIVCCVAIWPICYPSRANASSAPLTPFVQWQHLTGAYNEIGAEVSIYQQLLTYESIGMSIDQRNWMGLIDNATSRGQLATNSLRVHFTGKFAMASRLALRSQREFGTLWSKARHHTMVRALLGRAATDFGNAEGIVPPLGA